MSWLEQLRAINWGEASLGAIGAYVLGCFTTGYYLVRALKGTDIRTVASGSVGARNVSRVLGKTGFILTTVGDVLKGALSIWAARRFFHDDRVALAAMLGVVLLNDTEKLQWESTILDVLVILLVLGATLVFMYSAKQILRVIGESGANVLSRIMGLILAAVAVDSILNAVAQFFKISGVTPAGLL